MLLSRSSSKCKACCQWTIYVSLIWYMHYDTAGSEMQLILMEFIVHSMGMGFGIHMHKETYTTFRSHLKKFDLSLLQLCHFVLHLMLNYSVLPCKSWYTYKVQRAGSGWTCCQLVSAPSELEPVNWPIKQAAWQHRRVSIQRMRDGIASAQGKALVGFEELQPLFPVFSSIINVAPSEHLH